MALVCAQLAGVQTLRELITSLESHNNLIYNSGLDGVHRPTLSDANRKCLVTLNQRMVKNLHNTHPKNTPN